MTQTANDEFHEPLDVILAIQYLRVWVDKTRGGAANPALQMRNTSNEAHRAVKVRQQKRGKGTVNYDE